MVLVITSRVAILPATVGSLVISHAIRKVSTVPVTLQVSAFTALLAFVACTKFPFLYAFG